MHTILVRNRICLVFCAPLHRPRLHYRQRALSFTCTIFRCDPHSCLANPQLPRPGSDPAAQRHTLSFQTDTCHSSAETGLLYHSSRQSPPKFLSPQTSTGGPPTFPSIPSPLRDKTTPIPPRCLATTTRSVTPSPPTPTSPFGATPEI